MKRRTFVISPTDAHKSLPELLTRELRVGPKDAEALLVRGAVYVDGRRCLLARPALRSRQTVMVVLEEQGQSVLESHPPAPLSVVFEDDAVLAVNKPSGINAQPTPGRVGESLLDLASAHLGQGAGLVHRLDKETSGLTVFGKHPQATSALAAAFREGKARKTYWAVVGPGLPAEGRIDLPLSRDPARPGRFRAKAGHGTPAETLFRRQGEWDGYCLVELTPLTGRTHQLRAHLTALGFPIVGDVRYGGATLAGGLPAARCLLHARTLVLPHPTAGKPLSLEAPVHEDVQAFLNRSA